MIWFFFLVIYPIEKFEWLQLVGFTILLFGVLVYNEILVLPILGFNRYTEDARLKR